MKEGLFSLGRGPHKCRLVVGVQHSHCELLLQIMPSVCHGILKRHGLVQYCAKHIHGVKILLGRKQNFVIPTSTLS